MNSISVEMPGIRQKILVTGANGALGKAVVSRFLSAGWKVTGTQFSATPSSDLNLPSNVQWLKVDLTNSAEVKKVFADAEFDAVIHCAGGFRFAPVDELADEDLHFLLATNLSSAFYLVRSILPKMKKNNFGRIVFISSSATMQPGAGMAAYAASKAGLNSLTHSLAKEVQSFDITVNAVLPSVIDTAENRRAMPKADFSKWVPPEELANFIFTLISPIGKSIHGALIPVVGREL